MKHLTSAEVRQMFLDFFKEKGHAVEPSASLVPHEDPSLLWINSGVATLKKYFDGRVVPENPRIVNAQKAIRTNDIENVGKTARHHTFFEMLGNFSIGDYFKEEAITWAWEFLTSDKWIGFDQELLSVTVHPEDEEAYESGRKKLVFLRKELSAWKGTSGTSVKDRADRTRRSSTTAVRHMEMIQKIRSFTQEEKTTVTWKYGILCSLSSTITLTVRTRRFRRKTLIRAWGLKEWYLLSRMSRQTLIPIYLFQSSKQQKPFLVKYMAQTM